MHKPFKQSEPSIFMLFYDKFILWEMGCTPLWKIVLIDILTFFLLFFSTSIFDLKVSALNWRHIFPRAHNVLKRSPERNCTNKMF